MRDPKDPRLVHPKVFYRRHSWNLLYALLIVSGCLLLGILGYHYIAGIAWIDSLHNASMILSGMGPVVEIKNTSGKIFSSLYAIFSGVIFITTIGLVFAPIVHRLIHRLNLDEEA